MNCLCPTKCPKSRVFLLLTASLLAIGCNNNNNTNTIVPPSAQSITEVFSANLTPFSARILGFQVQSAGLVTAALTTLVEPDPDPDPDHPTVVGVDVGTLIGSTCQVVVSRTDMIQGQAISATANAAGGVCIRVYDVNSAGLTAPVDFTVTVTHF